MQEKCVLPGCDRNIFIKKHGLCVTHYCRFIRTGDVGPVKIAKRKWRKPFDVKKYNDSEYINK